MNKIYRLIWSRVSNTWVAVSENSKGRGKSGSAKKCVVGAASSSVWTELVEGHEAVHVSTSSTRTASLFVCAASMALLSPLALAAPTGGQISAGSGTIAQAGLNTTITQTSQNLAINWQGFNIAANEAVRFNQPNASAIALNRVTGQNPSQILGSLSANGQVFILNPNGVLFGAGSQVNVGGLVASTLSLSDADFMAGKNTFSGSGGSVVNQGNLTAAQAGYIALLAPEVRNEGVIVATLGTALLAAGDKVTLNLNNGSLVSFSIDQGALNALVDNKQLIQADGGQVYMSAKAADALSKAVVNNTGIIQARTIQNVAGTIKLIGDMEVGTVNVGGTLDASAPSPSASLLPLPQVGEGTTSPLPLAGEGQGRGGFIETSAAHVHIADSTTITTAAANGLSGTWLIDPVDFTIAATGGDMTGAALTTALGLGAVTILSTSGTVNTTTGLGDVNVNDAVSWSANLLTLNAQRNININAAMTATGTASLALQYGQGAVAAGNTSNIITGALGKVNLPAGTTNFTTKQGSDGTTKNYTVITALGAAGSVTTTDLQGMNGNLVLNYALGADIAAAGTSTWNAGAGFGPVGASTSLGTSFNGTFDGLGHTITGLTINSTARNFIGLFGATNYLSVIRNVGLVGGGVAGGTGGNVGGLVGWNQNGTISNSYTTGSVSSTTGGAVGGLVGYEYGGTISNSYATGNVSSTSGNWVGGLVGVNKVGTISNSYATGSVSSTSGSNLGGLVGYGLSGTVSNSYATGSVSGSSLVGGLVGYYNSGAISNSYHTTGSVTGTGTDVGGLVGLNLTTVTNSFYDMDVVTVNGAKPFNADAKGLYTAQFTGWKTNGFAFNPVTYFGAATAANTYTVTGVQGLKDLLGFTGNAALTFNLAGNIDLTTTPLPTGFYLPTWAGTFDGTGKTISNFTLNSNAFFGQTAAGSTIKNLGLLNVSVTGTTSGIVGGLVGINNGTISNSYATGNVSSASGSYIGGLVGYNNPRGTISNSYATVNVSSASGSYIGGLVGYNNRGAVSNSFYDIDAGTINGARPVTAYGLYTSQFTAWQTGGLVALNPVSYFGTATAANTYTVTGVQGLKDLLGFSGNAALTFNLAGNIDMTSTPLPTGFYIPTWAGTFDGTGKTISNFTLNSNASNLGLFGLTAAGSTIKNLGLLNVSVTGGTGNNVGGLVGYGKGTISNSYATGNVSSTSGWYVGGLVGYGSSGTISNSYATGSVSSTSGNNVGGLVGQNLSGTISNSYATGNVSTSGGHVGGLVGYGVGGTISNSYATGNVSSTSGWYVGGLVGYGSSDTISNSYATGSVSSTSGWCVGGLVGYGNSSTISNSYATGNVSSTSGGHVGGLVGGPRARLRIQPTSGMSPSLAKRTGWVSVAITGLPESPVRRRPV